MRMTQDRRPPSADVINVFIPVHVRDATAAGFADEERFPAHRTKRTHRRIDAARNVIERFSKQRLGFDP